MQAISSWFALGRVKISIHFTAVTKGKLTTKHKCGLLDLVDAFRHLSFLGSLVCKSFWSLGPITDSEKVLPS